MRHFRRMLSPCGIKDLILTATVFWQHYKKNPMHDFKVILEIMCYTNLFTRKHKRIIKQDMLWEMQCKVYITWLKLLCLISQSQTLFTLTSHTMSWGKMRKKGFTKPEILDGRCSEKKDLTSSLTDAFLYCPQQTWGPWVGTTMGSGAASIPFTYLNSWYWLFQVQSRNFVGFCLFVRLFFVCLVWFSLVLCVCVVFIFCFVLFLMTESVCRQVSYKHIWSSAPLAKRGLNSACTMLLGGKERAGAQAW